MNSAARELKSREPKWIVDIDDLSIKSDVWNWLCTFRPEEGMKVGEKVIYDEIPTVQGCHLIVKPFNLKKFSEVFPDVDVHKNSMETLLYYPNSLTTNENKSN